MRWIPLAAAVVAALAIGPTAEGGVAEKVRGQRIAQSSPPLEDPPVRPAGSAPHMRDDDVVLGVVVEGRARAYPWWVAKNFHVVNDVIGGVPVTVAFCEQCTGAAAFRRTVGGRRLGFEVAGVYNGTIILRDRETRTLWAPFSGRALEGKLAGRTLERLPLSFTRWDAWSARHPAGEVAWAPQVLRQGHGSWYEPGKWGVVTEMGETLPATDPRLPENALVYGVEDEGRARAYPLAGLRGQGGVVSDVFGSRPLVVVARGPLDVAAFDRTSGGRTLTFRAADSLQAVMNDEETGSDWSGDGEALDGPLRGARLRPLDGYVVEWHVWSAYHPGAELFGPPPSRAPTPSGLTFPPLTLAGLEGAPRAVSPGGAVNLFVLWAAWCPSCATEVPRVQRLLDRHAGQGLAAAGIAIHMPDDDAEKDAVRRFVSKNRIAFPTFLVDEPAYDRLEALCRSAGGAGLTLPTVFLTGPSGKILSVLSGREVEALPRVLEAHLKALGGAPSACPRLQPASGAP
jgi:hypothetical protein